MEVKMKKNKADCKEPSVEEKKEMEVTTDSDIKRKKSLYYFLFKGGLWH